MLCRKFDTGNLTGGKKQQPLRCATAVVFRSETLKKDYFLDDESKRSSNGDEVSATYLAPGVSLSTTLPFLT